MPDLRWNFRTYYAGSPPVAADTYVNITILCPSCAGPSARHAFTAHGRGHVRITTLRLFPAAAAEWAKPKEIRRGNSP